MPRWSSSNMPTARKAWNIVIRTRRTVDHGGVDDLPLAAALGFEQGAHHAEGQEHAPAAEVAHHVQRRRRALAPTTEVGEGAGQRDVVDVVAGPGGVGAVLAPAGHAAEHQLRVAGQAHLGPDPEALHHAGPEALDDGVGRLDQLEQRLHTVGVLEVDPDGAPPTVQHVPARGVGHLVAHVLGPVDADDVGAHVGQHHGAEGARSDAGDLDDAVPGERSGHDGLPLCGGAISFV